MLEIYNQTVDLSRRVVSYALKGMSFREFLEFEYNLKLEKQSLVAILNSHREIANRIIFDFKILPAFKKYLQNGKRFSKQNTTLVVRLTVLKKLFS